MSHKTELTLCLSSFGSGQPEPEPGIHGRMFSRSHRHDLWRGRVQDQNVKGQIPAAVYNGKLDAACAEYGFIHYS